MTTNYKPNIKPKEMMKKSFVWMFTAILLETFADKGHDIKDEMGF